LQYCVFCPKLEPTAPYQPVLIPSSKPEIHGEIEGREAPQMERPLRFWGSRERTFWILAASLDGA
jgi:hypothetical protein